ncbi:MAG: FtsK/SpoIIIE domain-containing protein [Bacilli bacterium]
MLDLLDNPTFDNERNILNADLFVSNLKNTLKAFKFNTKITYEVYRRTTVYHISWNDDKTYNNILEFKKEIALALGIRTEELEIQKISDNEVEIMVQNMKLEPLSLKELLSEFKKDEHFKIPLGFNQYDKIVSLDLDKDKSLLVTGVTGTGKTNLFNNIIMNILINYPNTKIVILDSQSINYNIYHDICEVINNEDDIITKIKEIRREFEKRIKNGNNERLVILIDEIYEIIKNNPSVKNDINYLLELGSITNINLIVSTDSIIYDDIYDLFSRKNTSKLSFYLTSRGEYNMFLGKVVTEDLNKDGMFLDMDKNLTRISVPLISDKEIERVVEYVKEK